MGKGRSMKHLHRRINSPCYLGNEAGTHTDRVRICCTSLATTVSCLYTLCFYSIPSIYMYIGVAELSNFASNRAGLL